MIEIMVYSGFSKRTNSTRVPDVAGQRVTVALKDEISIDNPVLLYQSLATDWLDWVYCYIPSLKSYYFVSDITSVRNGVWRISLTLDALATYREQILATTALVLYSQRNYNAMLLDSRVPSQTNAITIHNRSNLIGMDKNGTTIIICMSDSHTGSNLGGMASAYSVNTANINLIRDGLHALYNNDELANKIKNAYRSPFDAFLSAYWIPFKATSFGGSSERITIADYQFGNGYVISTPYVEIDQVVEIPHAYTDFRAAEPFSAYSLRLPCVGTVSLPADICARNSSITISGRYDYMGNISYNLRTQSDGTFASFGGNCSIQLPISVAATGNGMGVVQGIGEALSGAATFATGAAMAGIGARTRNGLQVAGGFMSAAGGAASVAMGLSNAINSASQKMYLSRGTLSGGAAGADDYIDVCCNYHPSADVSELGAVIGRPCNKVLPLSSLTGFVQTSGASVDIAAELEVRNAINNLLDGGIYVE